MKYYWKAKSNDGSYEEHSSRDFSTKKEAYEDMRNHALEKMKWNTEWSDFDDVAEWDYIGYNVSFHPDYISHDSYSGIYTYRIYEKPDKVEMHGRVWEVLDSYEPIDVQDWLVGDFDGVGTMWMNSYEGYIVIIERSGTILKSDI